MYKFYNPVRINYGFDCLENLENSVLELGENYKNVLFLVWDEKFLESKKFREIKSKFEKYEMKTRTYSASNPDVSDLYNIYTETKELDIDLVVAIGGGSILDIGKSLACLYQYEINSKDEIRKIISQKESKKTSCKWIGVPTTFGTGSELTCWATIWDKELNCKLSLENKNNYAYAVFIDPQFAESLPKSLLVSSALDATAHALEAYWSKNTNIISKAASLKSISCIMQNIGLLAEDNTNKEAQEAIANGSMLAGIAFSNTKTTACHAISYPLTLKYQIPHGIAVSMLIDPVLKINKTVLENDESLCSAFGVDSLDKIGMKILKILYDYEIPSKLSQWNVKKEDIEDLVHMCFTKGRIDNNPVQLNEEDIKNILKSIF